MLNRITRDHVRQYGCHLVRPPRPPTASLTAHAPPLLSHRSRPAAFEEPTLSRASHTGHTNDPTGNPTGHATGNPTGPATGPADGLTLGLRRFNALPPGVAQAALLACCGSRRWTQRIAAHRPYHDVDSLLAASDEASYDLSHADLAEALAAEASSGPPHSAPASARTALRAAHAAYESSFGHAFVISLDGHAPEEYLDHVLAGIRARLSHDPDHERSVSADELRRLARGRLTRLLASGPTAGAVGSATGTIGSTTGTVGSTTVAADCIAGSGQAG
ncbi:2-oxo-4-hydroxy-4-carboxy-5-ureidoimidazoline decarboxylase [Streptomyces sp. NPDC056835]|uniref:2-oxo-4-hydroxy-4-carboxy-5-ureidoimidazoline decarboxylase n=1 Tax=Streptomyces sp. NPDC056835 TaxID=3345956 RepID=UPI0036893107